MDSNEKQVGSIFEIPLDDLRPMEGQPRGYFSEDSLKKMANNIKEFGQKDPIKITKDNMIVSGERRWRAGKLAGLTSILVQYVDGDLYERAVLENLSRDDLITIEKAEAYKKLYEELKRKKDGMTYEKFGEIFNFNKASLSEYISIANMPAQIKDLFRCEPGATVRKLKKIALMKDDPEKQETAAKKYVEQLKQLTNGKKNKRKYDSSFFSKKLEGFKKHFKKLEDNWDTAFTSDEEEKDNIEELKKLKNQINKIIREKEKILGLGSRRKNLSEQCDMSG